VVIDLSICLRHRHTAQEEEAPQAAEKGEGEESCHPTLG
jgi:hypothetical protein